MNKKQNGFSLIELLIVLVVVILLGAASWLIYSNQHKNKTTPVSSNSSQSKTTSSDVTKYTTWVQIPSGLQNVILAESGLSPPLKAEGEYECDTTPQSTVTNSSPVLAENNAAITVYLCSSGFQILYVNINGSWQAVEMTQGEWSCSPIQQYNVPIALLEADNITQTPGNQGNGKPVTCVTSNDSVLTLAS